MFWLILLILILATPVRLRADVIRAEALDIVLHIRVWGLPLRRRMRLSPTAHGHRLITQTEDDPPQEPPAEQVRRSMVLLGTVLRTDKARRSLLRALRLERLDALISPSTADAARTAMFSGLLAGAAQLLHRKNVRIRIQPDFLHDRTTLQARCIIFFHLGSLLPAAAMAMTAAILEAREHRMSPAEEV